MKREDRKLQIIIAMLIRVENKSQPYTAHSLADALGMRPSPHFSGILNELVSAQFIRKIETAHRPNRSKYLLEPNLVLIKHYFPEAWKLHVSRKKERNQITVNSHGAQAQLFPDWRN